MWLEQKISHFVWTMTEILGEPLDVLESHMNFHGLYLLECRPGVDGTPLCRFQLSHPDFAVSPLKHGNVDALQDGGSDFLDHLVGVVPHGDVDNHRVAVMV